MKRIVILGAGPTGLGAGFRLKEIGYDNWDVYEMNPHVGGLSASFRDDKGFTWDIGGHIIFSHYRYYDEIIEKLLGDKVVSHERESWVRLMDTFVRYPFQNNFHFLPKDVVLECILGLIETRATGGKPKNFEEWIRKMFGDGIAKYFLIPYNNKVWSHPLTMMDFSWIGERVSVVDIKHVMRNIVYGKDDSSWGPNNLFLFPEHGGTGGLFEAFVPVLGERIKLSNKAVKVSLRERKVTFQNGDETEYGALISTIPADELAGITEDLPDEVSGAAESLRKAGGYIVGIGLAQPCPSDKNWMYFPEGNSPFYRVTYLSNYSPNMTPGGDHYSLLCETSYSQFKEVNRDAIIEETISGLINSGIIRVEDRKDIVSTYLIDVPYLLPVPTLGRDDAMSTIHSFLEERDIYTRGRFGGWKYEVGNMDHSVMQGVELVDRITGGGEETTYHTGI
jgi:protoporphyrinogen oxidase